MRPSFCLSLAALSLTFSAKALALSPPWYSYNAQIKATLGADPCVKVADLQKGEGATYNATLTVCERAKAEALNTFILKVKEFGNITVNVSVLGPEGEALPAPQPISGLEPAAIRSLLTTSLQGNPYFVEAGAGSAFTTVWLETSRAVVQFWGDNLADRHGNMNKVAAEAFAEVLDLKAFGRAVRTTTATR